MKGVVAKIAIDKSVTPVIQPVRKVPVHLLPIVNEKLDDMIAA